MEKNAKNAAFFYKERKRTQDCCVLLKRTDAQPLLCVSVVCWVCSVLCVLCVSVVCKCECCCPFFVYEHCMWVLLWVFCVWVLCVSVVCEYWSPWREKDKEVLEAVQKRPPGRSHAGLGIRSFQKNAKFLHSFAFFWKERNVLSFFCVLYKKNEMFSAFFCVLYKRTLRSLRSFTFFKKERSVLCVLLRSL